jgi:hypothetical protein
LHAEYSEGILNLEVKHSVRPDISLPVLLVSGITNKSDVGLTNYDSYKVWQLLGPNGTLFLAKHAAYSSFDETALLGSFVFLVE